EYGAILQHSSRVHVPRRVESSRDREAIAFRREQNSIAYGIGGGRQGSRGASGAPTTSSRDQHRAIVTQASRVFEFPLEELWHASDGRERLRLRIIQVSDAIQVSGGGDEHTAVLSSIRGSQKRRRVTTTGIRHFARGRRKSAGSRVVQLRGVDAAPCD